jgi:hypothetical protein
MARFTLLQAKKAGNKVRRKLTQQEKSVNAAGKLGFGFQVPGFKLRLQIKTIDFRIRL